MKRKTVNRKKLLNFLGVFLIILALALLALTMLMQVQRFAVRYEEFLQMLSDFEDSIAAIPNKGLVIIVILLIYIAKAFLPIPISAMCVIAGMVFETAYAVVINIAGFILLVTIKYLWGRHLGGGMVHKFLYSYDNVKNIIEYDSKAKDGLLVGFRLVPVMPINTVSQFYGAMNYGYYKYVALSILGFLPRIISYSMVGRHVYNPFSLAFMLPLVIIFAISGFAMIGINAFIDFYNNNKSKDETNGDK